MSIRGTFAAALAAGLLANAPAPAQAPPGQGNVELLLACPYRKSSGFPRVKGREWRELYKDSATGQWTVDRTRPQVARGHDACADEDIVTVGAAHETALALFTPFAGLMREPVTALAEQPLPPHLPLLFELAGQHYELVPQGDMADAEGRALSPAAMQDRSPEGPAYARIANYRIMLRMPDGTLHQLAGAEDIEAVTPAVLWAGDINADGLPDLLLDLGDCPECRHVLLFLSDAAHPAAPPRQAAARRVVNDC